MIELRRVLILVVAIELLVGGVLVGRRLGNPAPPLPDGSQLDSLTAQQLDRVRRRAIHGGWEPWRNYAQALLGQGFYAEAEQAFRIAHDLNPDDQETLYGLGFSLERMGRLEESIPILEQVASMSDDELSQTCWYQIGRGYLRLEKVQAAEQAFRRIETFPAAAFHLAKIQVRTGRAKEALPLIEQSLKQFPNSLKFIQLQARAAEALGDMETAQELYDRESRAEANLTLEYGMSFFTLYRSKHGLEKLFADCVRLRSTAPVSEQVGCIERALTIVRSENLIQYARIYVAAAELALGTGDPDRTLDLLDELKALEYQTPWTLQLRGEALFQLQEPQRRERLGNKALLCVPRRKLTKNWPRFSNSGEKPGKRSHTAPKPITSRDWILTAAISLNRPRLSFKRLWTSIPRERNPGTIWEKPIGFSATPKRPVPITSSV